MSEHQKLYDDAIKFTMLELPGQMPMMHMGTAYLVTGLVSALRKEEARLAEAERALRGIGWSTDAQGKWAARDSAEPERPADSAPAVTGNCGLCGQPRADHAEIAPDGKPECRMKENSHHE